MVAADNWKDYRLIDSGDGERLEMWGKYVLVRPDPQVIWPKTSPELWKDIHARYTRSSNGGGSWEYYKEVPKRWNISYRELKFIIEPMGFKHTGLFPEQAANWEWMSNIIKNNKGCKVLNLFAYTGGATVAASAAGANVCHVDAAKGMVQKAKENAELSGLSGNVIRYIVDDVLKFVNREKKRNSLYEGIIMDPPSYGRGPNGEVWKLEDNLFSLVSDTIEAFSQRPLFFLLNSYTTGISPSVSANILEMTVKKKLGGKVTCDEIGLPVEQSKTILPCGAFARWEK